MAVPVPLHRPYVLANMAMTADGKIATANRRISTFGSPRDHRHLYELRATADAILCGASTANAPGVTLDAGGPRFRRQRIAGGLAPEPLAVIVSGRGHLRPDAGVFQRPDPERPPVVLVSRAAPPRALGALRAAGAEVQVFGKVSVDLKAALAWLFRKHGVRRLVAEGGGELNDALVRGGWVDEWHITLCPVLVGGRAAPTLAEGVGTPELSSAARYHPPQVRRHGSELFLVLRKV